MNLVDQARPNRFMVSVIVPSLNEEGVIGQCLESLERVNFPRGAFEVILVDNGSTDRTVEIAKSFAPSLNLTVLHKTDAHISAVRNFGAASAQGGYLAFLDADTLVASTWLVQACSLLSTEGIGVIGAPHRIPQHSSWVARTWYQERQTDRRGRVSYVASGNLLVSRPNFLLIGGFDETLETNEDCEFCHRAQALGLSVLSFPEIAVVHLGTPQTLGSFYRNQRWHGRHVFKVFLRDPLAFRNARAVFFALYTLFCLAGGVWGLGIIVAYKRWAVLAISVLAALLAPLLLSVRVAMARRRWGILLPLSALYFVYGVARAMCLLEMDNWLGKKNCAGQAEPGQRILDEEI